MLCDSGVVRLLATVLSTLLLLVLLPATPAAADADPRWVFYTADKTRYTSPWFRGAHRIMIPFGCTRAPYYSPDPRCRDGRGFHHGLDVAMPCGTRLFARTRLRVVDNSSLGPAYGANPLLLRSRSQGFDVVIGHTRQVYVERGDLVRRGQLIARASDDGAPDGCHLHFERRAVGGGLSTAVAPRKLLRLERRR
ncbi:Peptidase family M23 [Nocardioides lianchengensis]|uniref:Peptidase family M23 n=1 Tax=Nocardioides lianchengensis TaxID=1045774 RepID=A0A1G6NL20_9ACTN|nr:Peptidase family M23 [Nocardioides lianchengensis]